MSIHLHSNNQFIKIGLWFYVLWDISLGMLSLFMGISCASFFTFLQKHCLDFNPGSLLSLIFIQSSFPQLFGGRCRLCMALFLSVCLQSSSHCLVFLNTGTHFGDQFFWVYLDLSFLFCWPVYSRSIFRCCSIVHRSCHYCFNLLSFFFFELYSNKISDIYLILY